MKSAEEENGCLCYVQGSADHGMRPFYRRRTRLLPSDHNNRSVHRPHGFSGIYGFSQRITDYAMEGNDREREMVMVAGPGDLIIHNSLLIHRAPPNTTTDRSRRAVGSIFYGASAVVDEEKYQARQKQIQERAAALEGQTQASVGL